MGTPTPTYNINIREVPEADGIEQQLPVVDADSETADEVIAVSDEVNEADAFEQTLHVLNDDEEDYPHAGVLDDVGVITV